MCVGRGRSSASRPHSEPAGNLQNPKHPGWNTGASGGDVTYSIRRQRPYLHLHLPVHLQSLHQHADCAPAAARQVGMESSVTEKTVVINTRFICISDELYQFSVAGMDVWKKMSQRQEDAKVLRPMEQSGCKKHLNMFMYYVE